MSSRLPWDYLLLVAILIPAAWLRYRYIQHYNPWVDEYSTMLAARMIAEKGLPLFPSGLLYEHGILFSYLVALSIKLFGFSEMAVRWPSLFLNLTSLILLFALGRRYFSRATALLALLPVAFLGEMMVWGGRARMYSLLILLVLLVAHFAYQSTHSTHPRRDRLLALLCFAGAVLTHFNALLLVPSLLLAMAVVQLGPRLRVSLLALIRTYWLEGLLLAGIALGAIILKRLGQPKGAEAYETVVEEKGLGALWDAILVIYNTYGGLGAGWNEGLGKFIFHFTGRLWLPLTLLFLAGVLVSGAALLRRHHRGEALNERTRFLVFCCTIWLTTLLLMLTVVHGERRETKYLDMIFPLLSLIAAEMLVRTGEWAGHLLDRRRPGWGIRLQVLLFVGTLVGGIVFYLPSSTILFTGQELGYNRTLRYVRDHLQPGDVVISSFTPPCALYLEWCNYYATEDPPQRRLLPDPAGDPDPVDRWAGATLLDSETDLERVLRESERVWFISDRARLDAYYQAPFRNLIFNQMQPVSEENDSIVFLKDGPFRDIFPQYQVNAVLGDQLRLWGYDLNDQTFRPGQMIELTLYWEALASPAHNYTIFVHLRRADESNITQFDAQPFDGTFPTSAWGPGEIVQQPVSLPLPLDLSPGQYPIKAGMYLLATLERLPVANDQSGENAVILTTITVEGE